MRLDIFQIINMSLTLLQGINIIYQRVAINIVIKSI